MSAYLFPLYALIHACLFCWCMYLWRAYRTPGAPLVAMICAALTYDNFIISVGTTIGIGPLLEGLSWPRFALHALLTPFMMIAATQIAQAGGIRWAEGRRWKIFIWLLVAAMIVVGAFESLIGLELVPACFDGIVRYTSNLSPSHFCYEGQEVVKGGGPPIPSIIGNIITLVVGFALWRHNGWPWLMAGSLIMFVAAAVPFSIFGMAPGNGGEVVLMASYAISVARFGRFSKTAYA